MDVITGLVVIGVMYGVLFFFDNFFKTCAHYPYIKFLEGTGVQVGFFSIKWTTKAFNRTLIKWGNNRPHLLNLWFTIGLYASLILLPISLLLLLYSLFQNIFSSNIEGQLVIEPIVPGVNLPASELGYYSLTLVLCSIVHELGHALAAVSEDVNLIDTGANILFILPIAYVNLSTEKFSSLNHKKVLKIVCAGVWHNLVLTLVAFVLFMLLPFIFSLFYHVNRGVTVSNIAKLSPLAATRGLSVGDTIFKINECMVLNENSWYECLGIIEEQKPAFCVESRLIHDLDESIPLKHLENGNLDCCESKMTKNICFEYLDTADGILELPGHACLPARTIVEKSTNYCSSKPHHCPENSFCFRPILANGTNLFKIICDSKDVIYVGLAADIYRTVEVSSYIPKAVFHTTTLPDVLTKFVKYTALFSLGLAVVNVIPFMYMDGEHIADVLGTILLRRKCGKNAAKLITAIIVWVFTLLWIIHCIITVSKIML